MSHHGKLREYRACENCGHYVEKRFCPECGQENVETRQPFHYLFTISIEDFIHYDSRFWKTILYLLFYPARLTKIYLSGKRIRHVPPVTLYIFISFITFFLPAILPDTSNEKQETPQETTTQVQEDNKENLSKHKKETNFIGGKSFNKEKFQERIIHDFPKAIFLYMPVFAFWLWVFHSKKDWFYFDHGVYTLHYFSFILLCILLYILIFWLSSFFHFEIHSVKVLVTLTMFGYFIYYFFHSHRLVYQETKAISRLKCSFLFFINTICIFIFLLSFLILEVYFTDNSFFKEIISSIRESW